MIDLIKPYPGEDELSYTKRKAYFYRVSKIRTRVGDFALVNQEENCQPLSVEETEEINAFWDNYLSPTMREKLIDYRYYSVYKAVVKEDENLLDYIPDSFYQTFIDDYYSNPQESRSCDDKNLYDLYFHDINRPKTIFRKTKSLYLDENYDLISMQEAIERAKSKKEVILKISKFSLGGHGVMFWDAKSSNVEQMMKFLNSSDRIVCQEVLRQHEVLNRVNPTSVNTIRIVSFLFNGKVNILSSVLRMGRNGSRVDNASSGGIVCGIKPNGQLKNVAYDTYANVYHKHPQGTEFESIIIPNYTQCIGLVNKLAKRFSLISRLISWDLAIDENAQPLLIEGNLTFGELDFHQMCNGPIFGDLTEEVLKDVFANSYTLNSILKSF